MVAGLRAGPLCRDPLHRVERLPKTAAEVALAGETRTPGPLGAAAAPYLPPGDRGRVEAGLGRAVASGPTRSYNGSQARRRAGDHLAADADLRRELRHGRQAADCSLEDRRWEP